MSIRSSSALRRRPSRQSTRACAFASAIAALTASATTSYAVPAAIPYVGELRYDSGAPYQGSPSVAVAIYAGAGGAAPLWGPHTWPGVNVVGGTLALLLGGGDSPPVDAALLAQPELWLEIAVDGQMLTPRQRIHSVPYARLAGDAAALGGHPAASYATLSAVQDLLAGYVPADLLPDVLIGDFALAGQSCPTGQVATGFDAEGGVLCEEGLFNAASCSECLQPLAAGQQTLQTSVSNLATAVQQVQGSVNTVSSDLGAASSDTASILALVEQLRSLTGEYSLTCNDWQARGWTSKTACLQDGRWHEVLRIQGPFSVSAIVSNAMTAFCSNAPGLPTEMLVSFDDNVNPWLKCYGTNECSDFWCYDGAGQVRLRIENGNGSLLNLNGGNSVNNWINYRVRY